MPTWRAPVSTTTGRCAAAVRIESEISLSIHKLANSSMESRNWQYGTPPPAPRLPFGGGVAASAGQGRPAFEFPVDTPAGLATDTFGNVYVTSRTVVRLLAADAAGVVDGSGAVTTVFGAPPRDTYPASIASCLTGVAVVDAAPGEVSDTVQVTDACTGLLIELWRQPVTP